MCELTQKVKDKKSISGYKIVLVKKSTGKNYSLAMGFCYDDYERIPIPKRQKRFTSYFTNFLFNKQHGAYTKAMEGRTAIFKNLEDALRIVNHIAYWIHTHEEASDYNLVLKEAIVSIDLMKGNYSNSIVYAGRKIEFRNEVTKLIIDKCFIGRSEELIEEY